MGEAAIFTLITKTSEMKKAAWLRFQVMGVDARVTFQTKAGFEKFAKLKLFYGGAFVRKGALVSLEEPSLGRK